MLRIFCQDHLNSVIAELTKDHEAHPAFSSLIDKLHYLSHYGEDPKAFQESSHTETKIFKDFSGKGFTFEAMRVGYRYAESGEMELWTEHLISGGLIYDEREQTYSVHT